MAELELASMNIILKVPETSVSLKIIASVVNDDMSIDTVERTIPMSDLLQARKDFLENVQDGDDYDAVYTLTDAAKEYLSKFHDV